MAKLHRHFSLSFGMDEIKYWYGLNHSKGKWNLNTRLSSLSIVEGLTSSHKGVYNDINEITGAVEPDPTNNPILKQFGCPGVFMFLLFYLTWWFLLSYTWLALCFSLLVEGEAEVDFAKPSVVFVKVDQINTISHHTRLGNPRPLNHPRSMHNILIYQ